MAVRQGTFKVRFKDGTVAEKEVHTYAQFGYSFVLHRGDRVKVERCLDTWYEVPCRCDYVFKNYFKADDLEEYRFLVECFTEKGYKLDTEDMYAERYYGDMIVTRFSSDREDILIEIPAKQYKGRFQIVLGKWCKC